MFHVKHHGFLPYNARVGKIVMIRIIAIVNQKGGVGKTTTAINLGASLASAEFRVLLVDLDPQGNTTSGLGVDKSEAYLSTYDVLSLGNNASSAIQETELGTLHLLPANRSLVGATVELLDSPAREYRLKKALRGVKGAYDFILVDCPPSLGILTINGLVAADSVLIPIQAEYFSLEGLSDLMDTIQRVQDTCNSNLKVEGVLLTMYDDRLVLSSQIRADVRSHLGSQVFDTFIPRNVRLAECASFGKPILLYDARSKGANSYQNLAREILGRYRPNPAPDQLQASSEESQ